MISLVLNLGYNNVWGPSSAYGGGAIITPLYLWICYRSTIYNSIYVGLG